MGEKFRKNWSRRQGMNLGKKEEKMDSVLNVLYLKCPLAFRYMQPKGNCKYGFGTLERGCGYGYRGGNHQHSASTQ